MKDHKFLHRMKINDIQFLCTDVYFDILFSIQIVKDGVIIKSLQYDGCVPKMYLKSPIAKSEDYKIGEKVCLYFNKLIYNFKF